MNLIQTLKITEIMNNYNVSSFYDAVDHLSVPYCVVFLNAGGKVYVYDSGSCIWKRYDLYHREDGPAFEYSNGGVEWWLHGSRYALPEEYAAAVAELQKKRAA